MRGARTTPLGLLILLTLGGCEGKGGGGASPPRDPTTADAVVTKAAKSAEPSPDPTSASASHVGHIAATIDGRAIRFDVLPAKGNNVAPSGRAWSAVLTAHGEPGSTEQLVLRLQNFDFGGLAGGKPVAPHVRRQRGQIAALSYTDPSGAQYGGHVGPAGKVDVTIDTWDPANLRLTGKLSGTLQAKDETSVRIEDGTFEIRRNPG